MALIIGIVVFLVTPKTWLLDTRILLGWIGFCLTLLVRIWGKILKATPDETHYLATREDDTHVVASAVTLAATLVSLVGVGFILHRVSLIKGTEAFSLTGLAMATVVFSWMLVHSQYTLHYARQFYLDKGGINFQDGNTTLKTPTYLEFAYLSFTIGMTFQVSDTNLTSRAMRRLLLGHAFLSYLYSAVIIAVTVNAVASLLG